MLRFLKIAKTISGRRQQGNHNKDSMGVDRQDIVLHPAKKQGASYSRDAAVINVPFRRNEVGRMIVSLHCAFPVISRPDW